MLLDTSAWIEFFQDTDKCPIVESILKNEENFTSEVTFAEIVNWCFKNKIEDKIISYIEGIKKGSKILKLDEAIIVSAGKLNFEIHKNRRFLGRQKSEGFFSGKKIIKRWGMIDSLILSTALFYDLKILTKDSHFKGLENVEML